MRINSVILLGLATVPASQAFVRTEFACKTDVCQPSITTLRSSSSTESTSVLDNLLSIFQPKPTVPKTLVAQDLVTKLVTDEKAYSTVEGAKEFAAACADDVVYEDCFSADSPFIGRDAVLQLMMDKVESRKGRGDLRMDRVSDGSVACGFAWTYVSGNEEGLRGTTFVQLNEDNEIQYVREIPEPLFKPGNLTVALLEAITKDAPPRPDPMYTQRTPTMASDIAKYLFKEVNGDLEESMRFFGEDIIYRDFNFEEPLRSRGEVRGFISDFSFPGITFVIDRCDDGAEKTCFTWEVKIDGQEQVVKGISYYEVNSDTRKINYVRDIPESPTKPPPLGSLARKIRPGLGVFSGVPAGSRPGGK